MEINVDMDKVYEQVTRELNIHLIENRKKPIKAYDKDITIDAIESIVSLPESVSDIEDYIVYQSMRHIKKYSKNLLR